MRDAALIRLQELDPEAAQPIVLNRIRLNCLQILGENFSSV
jgi:hypothetical protein